MPEVASPRRSRLSGEREQEILRVALDQVAQHGYDALTMDLVAAAAHTSKATLYRRWSGKADLVAAALRLRFALGQPIDTGSLRGDLESLLDDALAAKASAPNLLTMLGPAIMLDRELCRAVHTELAQPAVELLRVIVQRAVGRGEVPPDLPVLPYLPSVLHGVLVGKDLWWSDGVPASFVDGYLTHAVLPLLQRPGAPAASSAPLTTRPLDPQEF